MRGTWGLSLRCLGGSAEFECKARGAARMAYPSVVAGGTDSCTIHYLRNNKVRCSTALCTTLLLLMYLYSFWQRQVRSMQPEREDDITKPSIWYSATKGLLEARTPVDPSCEGLHQVTPAFCSSCCCALLVHRTCQCMPSRAALGR